MSQMVWTFPGGQLKQEVTSITLVNATAKTQDVTVPTGKIWVLLGIKIANADDVTRIVTVDKFKEAGKTNLIARLVAVSLATTVIVHWPVGSASTAERSISTKPAEILVAGNTLSVVWASGGASTGSVDADGLVVEYLEIDL